MKLLRRSSAAVLVLLSAFAALLLTSNGVDLVDKNIGDAILRTNLRIRSVFYTKEFPEPKFSHPALVKKLLGAPYQIRTRYFDRSFREVSRAEVAGRYGALIQVLVNGEEIYRQHFTLFHYPSALTREGEDLRFTAGFQGQVLDEGTSKIFDTFFKYHFVDVYTNTGLGVLMAGLHELEPNRANIDAHYIFDQDRAWWYHLMQKIGEIPKYSYIIELPDQHSLDSEKLPLVLYLHGSGLRGAGLKRLRASIPKSLFPSTGQEPFILVAPQLPDGEWWFDMQLKDLIDEVVAKHNVDADRLYVTGVSMGGYGTWALATQFLDVFAAIAPVCGGVHPYDAEKIQHLPVWNFHGTEDRAVPFIESSRMMDFLVKINEDARFTEYSGAGHNIASQVFSDGKVLDWLLKQSRSNKHE